MTFTLGERSRKGLDVVHPSLVRVVEAAIAITAVDFAVDDGPRTKEEQRPDVGTGVSMTLDSKRLRHADGMGHAVHLVPNVNGTPRWEWPLISPIAPAIHRAATELKVTLRWGAVWDTTFLSLSPYSPELNPVESVWQFFCQNYLSNRVYDRSEAIIDSYCAAWNELIASPDCITYIAKREWAAVSV